MRIKSDRPWQDLRECADLIASSVCCIFNRSITTSIFPEEWKCSKVISLLKQGRNAPTLKNNYRPISIIPVVGKVFERVVYDQFYMYLTFSPAKWRLGNERKIPYWWRVTTQIWVLLLIGWSKFPPRYTTNQNHYSDLGSDASSVWNFCARFSDVISRGNQWWRRQMSAVFSVYFAICHREFISVSVLFYIPYEFLFVIRQHYQNRNIAKHEQAVLHF